MGEYKRDGTGQTDSKRCCAEHHTVQAFEEADSEHFKSSDTTLSMWMVTVTQFTYNNLCELYCSSLPCDCEPGILRQTRTYFNNLPNANVYARQTFEDYLTRDLTYLIPEEKLAAWNTLKNELMQGTHLVCEMTERLRSFGPQRHFDIEISRIQPMDGRL